MTPIGHFILRQSLSLLGPDGQLAAFKMDLDDFRVVNNSLGHASGDDALRLYCSIVKKVLGRAGEVYRRGGDEVVAFAPGLEATVAQTLAEEVRAGIESEFRDWSVQRGLTSFPTASIGLVLTNGSRSFDEIVLLMDNAQHEAKQQGKNRVVCRR